MFTQENWEEEFELVTSASWWVIHSRLNYPLKTYFFNLDGLNYIAIWRPQLYEILISNSLPLIWVLLLFQKIYIYGYYSAVTYGEKMKREFSNAIGPHQSPPKNIVSNLLGQLWFEPISCAHVKQSSDR